MTALRCNSAKPEITSYLFVEPAFGSLRVKLMEPRDKGNDNVVTFVIASPNWLAKGLASDLKTNKGNTVTCRFTWTDSPNGFNFHLTRADATTLLNYCKELNHV